MPLYKAIFDKNKGGVLPPAAALERELVGLGVSEKQKGRAREVFERSAEQAGFFEHGKLNRRCPDDGSGSHNRKGEEGKSHGGGTGGGGGGEEERVLKLSSN